MIRSAVCSCTLSCTGIQPLSWIAGCNYSSQSWRITYLMWSTSKEYRHLQLLLRAIANWHMFPTANLKNGGRVISNAALHSGSLYDPYTTAFGAGSVDVANFKSRRQLISRKKGIISNTRPENAWLSVRCSLNLWVWQKFGSLGPEDQSL